MQTKYISDENLSAPDTTAMPCAGCVGCRISDEDLSASDDRPSPPYPICRISDEELSASDDSPSPFFPTCRISDEELSASDTVAPCGFLCGTLLIDA